MRINLIFLFVLTALSGFSQVFNMKDTTVSTCSGVFYDDGGANGNYNDYRSYTQTFNSSNGGRLQFNFQLFNTFNANDFLIAYDGPNNTFPIIGTWNTSASPFVITSTGTSITFRFVTNGAGSSTAGFAATIACVGSTVPAVFSMNSGTITTCDGIWYDSGGPTSSYGQGENHIQTICSGSSQSVTLDFRKFPSNRFSLSSGDTLWAYDGTSTSSPPIGAYWGNFQPEIITSSSSCLTMEFKSDALNQGTGWQAEIGCTANPQPNTNFSMQSGIRYVCNGNFYDDGGPNNGYDDYTSRVQTFISTTGQPLEFVFNAFSTFNGNDYLEIFDGPTTSFPRIGIYSTATSPGTFRSTGNAVTFRFVTNSAGSNTAGWAATYRCLGTTGPNFAMTNGTIQACNGQFYDSGGPLRNYGNGENIIQTFEAPAGRKLHFNFKPYDQNNFDLSSGDSLWVYDGSSINDPLVGIYVNNHVPEIIHSSGNFLTFQFKSDALNTSIGWQSIFYCDTISLQTTQFTMNGGVRVVCSGTFFDNGGPNGNYDDYQSNIQTFISPNNQRFQFQFNSFSTFNSSDYLEIYDGANINAPRIGTYSNVDPIGTITTTGNAITFRFITNSAGSNTAGWSASFSCFGQNLTTYPMNSGTVLGCQGVFYDSGGPFLGYQPGELFTQTFQTSRGKFLHFNFQEFKNNRFSLASGDSLLVYDGPNSQSPLIGIYVQDYPPELIHSSDSSLTFQFKSDALNQSAGWQARFYCDSIPPVTQNYPMSGGLRVVCAGTFTDDGGINGNYDDYRTRIQTFTSQNNQRLEFDFASFSTFNSSDYLEIYDGPSLQYPRIGTFSVSTNPGKITSTGNSITFRFVSNSAGSSTAGWSASIRCFGSSLPVVSMGSGIVNGCAGVFYDSGGPDLGYSNGENRVQSFCAGSGQRMVFDFAKYPNNRFSLGSGDSLFVYDGLVIGQNPIAIYTSDGLPEKVVSSTSCVTFFFKSDAIGTSSGWQAEFFCDSFARPNPVYPMASGVRFVCQAQFLDDGGLNGNYDDYRTRIQTFASSNGRNLEAVFGSFNTINSSDFLVIYDGWSTSSPVIGTYSGGTSPGTVVSSGDALTFRFVTNSAGTTSAGWNAQIRCIVAPPVIDSILPRNACAGSNVQVYFSSPVSFGTGNEFVVEMSDETGLFNLPLIVHRQLGTVGGVMTFQLPKGMFSGNYRFRILGSNPSSQGPIYTDTIQVTGIYGDAISRTNWIYRGEFGAKQYYLSRFANTWQNARNVCRNAGGQLLQINSMSELVLAMGITPNEILHLGISDEQTEGTWINQNGNSVGFTYWDVGQPDNFNNSDFGAFRTNSGLWLNITNNFAYRFVMEMNDLRSDTQIICRGNTISLNAGNVLGANYLWSGPQGFTSTRINPTISPAQPNQSGLYEVTISKNGCQQVLPKTQILVDSQSVLVVLSSNSPVCANDSLRLTAQTVLGATYFWTGPGGFSSTQQNPRIRAVFGNSGAYICRISRGTCTAQDTVWVSINQSGAPLVNIAVNATNLCDLDTFSFSSTVSNFGTSIQYQWLINGIAQIGAIQPNWKTTQLINGDQVSLRVLGNNTCSAIQTATSSSITVSVASPLTPQIQIINPIVTYCLGDSAFFQSSIQNGGGVPMIEWWVNGVFQSRGSTFWKRNIQNNDSISVRLISSEGCVTTSTASTSRILQVSVPTSVAVQVTSSAAGPICSGTAVTFTATLQNATSGNYRWIKNGVFTGVTNSTFTTTGLNHLDSVWVDVVVSGGCFVSNQISSNRITIQVNPSVIPSIAISGQNGQQCIGTTVNYSAVPTNGGNSPSIEWYWNNVLVDTGLTYSNVVSSGNFQVIAKLASSLACPTSALVTSNAIIGIGINGTAPDLLISSNLNNNTICAGQTATFTATIQGGTFSGPTIQWYKNSNLMGTGNSFSTSVLNQGDQIWAIVQVVSGTCLIRNSDTSNTLVIQVGNSVTPSVTITSNISNDSICSGQTISFTASPTFGGANPTYSWRRNGVAVGFNSSTYSTIFVSNRDSFWVVLTSNEACATPATVSSNKKILTVLATPGIPTIITNDPVCLGDSLFLQATGTGVGSFIWSLPNLTGTQTGNQIRVISTLSMSGTWSVVRWNGACSSSVRTRSITVNPLPAKPLITWFGPGALQSSYFGFDNQWNRNGQPIGGETLSVLQVILPGIYTVTYTDPFTGCRSTSDPFIITNSSQLAIQPLKIYPNPTKSEVFWETVQQVDRVKLISPLGQILMDIQSPMEKKVNVLDLVPGVYFVEFFIGNQVIRKKVIIDR